MKLWLDDVRKPPEGWTWAKTADEAIELLKGGEVTDISLDHDLAEPPSSQKTGHDVASWIADHVMKIPPLKWAVHSGNQYGAANIRAVMTQADQCREWFRRGCL